MARLLLLGGSAEAAALAELLDGEPGLRVVTSLAGRTANPRPVAGELRTGGFGGVAGLRRYIEDEGIDLVVDATHPFSSAICRHAAQACAGAAIPHLRLMRPAWARRPGDDWIEVPHARAAAEALRARAGRVFLTTGRKEIEAFRELHAWFLVRLIDPPAGRLPLADYELLLARGPFEEAAEIELLERHRIDLIVAKNSGGTATYSKIAAARTRHCPVIMIARPDPAPGPSTPSVEAARDWVLSTV